MSDRLHQAPAALMRSLAVDTAKVFGVILALGSAIVDYHPGQLGWDSHAYWLAERGAMYTTGPMTTDAYLYSPAFAQFTRLLTFLPWPLFAVLWSTLLGMVLAWLLVPLRWWAIPLWLAALPEIRAGNIFILLALVAVLGLRHYSVWAFAALTKVALCLGPVWFAVRREWRPLFVSLAATATVALLSWVFAPHLWVEWTHLLISQGSKSSHPLGSADFPALIYRLPVAMLLAAWGAHYDKRWVLPIGMVLASPVLWLGTFTMLAALPRLQDRSMPPAAAEVFPVKNATSS
jgi:hypothetical protein